MYHRLTLMLYAMNLGDMMQAAVNGTTIDTPSPAWILNLQCRPFDLNPEASSDVLPIFIPRKSDASPVPSRVRRYHELRPYGRLVSVEVNVDMGFAEKGDVVYFWDDASVKALFNDIQTTGFPLAPKVFDPMCVYCTVRPYAMCKRVQLTGNI
jgi:hypothetical protein